MAYESIKKPASTFVPVQKKASVSAPPGMMGQQQETSVPSGQEQTLSNKPATDDDWLMKSGLFTGQHLLQRLASPVSESVSSEREETKGLGQVEPKEDEIVQGTETAIPYSRSADAHGGSLLPTPHSLPLQAKLTIGEPGDKYEQEADRVASQVVKQINSPDAAQSTQGQSVQRQEEPEEELQAKPRFSDNQQSPLPLEVQREAMPEGEELQAMSILQRRQAIAGGEATNHLDTAINSARGGGQALDAGLQRSMGQAMGADFSGVRVHTDAQSDQLNQSIQAKAFTTGQDVFFRQGAYEPGSRGGQELLAHELTHVVQQSGGAVEVQRLGDPLFESLKKVGGVKADVTIKNWEKVAKLHFKLTKEDATEHQMGAADAEGLNELANQILGKYPPKSNIYVSVGASADLVTTYMRRVNQDVVARWLPISTVEDDHKQLLEYTEPTVKKDSERRFKRKKFDRLVAYIDKSLRLQGTDKTIVLLDATDKGNTQMLLKGLIEYLYPGLTVKPLSISRSGYEGVGGDKFNNTEIELITPSNKARHFMERIHTKFFKTYLGRSFKKADIEALLNEPNFEPELSEIGQESIDFFCAIAQYINYPDSMSDSEREAIEESLQFAAL